MVARVAKPKNLGYAATSTARAGQSTGEDRDEREKGRQNAQQQKKSQPINNRSAIERFFFKSPIDLLA